MYGKTIELFLVNGDPDGIISAHLSNWNGEAYKIPRITVSDYARNDISKAGIYFLFCKPESDSERESVYVGESENVLKRLTEHIRDYDNGKEKFYWISAVVFTGTELDKTSIRYLENKAACATRDSDRFDILTKNTFNNTTISEAKQASMDEYFENIKILLSALGYKVLEPLVIPTAKKYEPEPAMIFSLVSSNVRASMMQTTDGCVVLKGSQMREHEASMTQKYKEIRDKLLNSKVIKDYVFQEDYLFSSPSAASCVLLGNSNSGPQYWKTPDGTLLGELSKKKQNSET